MNKYVIFSDSTADLPEDFMNEHHIVKIPLYYDMEGITYGGKESLPVKEFYDKMRNGIMPTTSGSNPEFIRQKYEEYLDQGYGIIHICFSSALSNSAGNAFMTAREMKEERPDAEIYCIDSLCASLGQGLFVYYALKNLEEGLSIKDNVEWLEKHKLNICHQFTVEDLFHLYRGGRVSKTTAILGTMVNIKPILHVDNEGRLIPLSNVRGRKKSLSTLVDNMIKTMGEFKDQNQIVFISHGDSIEDARYVASLVEKKTGITNFVINPVSPTIGAHSGPGTIALFYLGETR